MKFFRCGMQYSFCALGLVLASSASAQPGGTIVYGSNATSVPTLSGGLLIVLAVVMAVVALRLLKSQSNARLSSWVVAAGALALVSGLGGVKLISDGFAGPTIKELTSASGGQVSVGVGSTRVVNTSSTTLSILSLNASSGCSFDAPENGGGGGGLNGGNGGVDRGTCSDSPSTALAPADYCDVFVSCDT